MVTETSVEWTEDRVQRSKSTGYPERNVELQFFAKTRPIFDLNDLLGASAELMGKGRLGSTYKTTLESGVIVAVKRLQEMNGLSKKEFIQQMQLLGNMKHDNLVEIISFYYSEEEKLVVYEYVQGGSLSELLHGIFFSSLSLILPKSLDFIKVTTQEAMLILFLDYLGFYFSKTLLNFSLILLLSDKRSEFFLHCPVVSKFEMK